MRLNVENAVSEPEKNPEPIRFRDLFLRKLHGALHFAAAQAASANIDVLGGAVDNSLNTLHVGLPHTVGTPMGVADLDAESHTFSANLTFCHLNQLLPAGS